MLLPRAGAGAGRDLQYKTEKHPVTATYRASFDVFGGDRFVLLGPSGCGNPRCSRRSAATWRRPRLDRARRPPDQRARTHRIFVLQEFDQLVRWKRVKHNVVFALAASGKLCGKAAEAQAMRYIDKVNLPPSSPIRIHTRSQAA